MLVSINPYILDAASSGETINTKVCEAASSLNLDAIYKSSNKLQKLIFINGSTAITCRGSYVCVYKNDIIYVACLFLIKIFIL